MLSGPRHKPPGYAIIFAMKIHIRYFASFREITERTEETMTVDEATSVSDVRALLVARYPRLQPFMERSAYAVNRGYVPVETALHDGDELVFIPPMGGGRPRPLPGSQELL